MTEAFKVSQADKYTAFAIYNAYRSDGNPNRSAELVARVRHESQLLLLEALEEAREAINVTRHLVAADSFEGDVSEAIYLNNGPLSIIERKIDTLLATIRGEGS